MARLTISPSVARRHALVWRVAAVALAAVAGALWAFQTPLGSAAVSLGVRDAGASPGPTGPARPVTPVSMLDAETARGIQDRLDHAYDRPARQEPVRPEPNPVAAIATWRYLGAITTSKHRSALVSVDARQHVVREGSVLRYKDTTGAEVSVALVEVQPDSIVIDDGSGLREIKREMRTGPAVAWVTPGMNLTPDQMQRRAEMEAARMERAAAAANGLPPGAATPGMTPDQLALMRERGVSPAQATQARERLEQLRSRARNRGAATISPDGTTTTNDTKGSKDATENEAPESNR